MHYQSIQALRAVAAMLVMVHHLTNGRYLTGAAGVDVFFVISGFIMGSVERVVPPADFILKRMIRIIPLYWLITISMCVISLAGMFTNFTFNAASITCSLLFIPYPDQNGNIWPLVVPGWTLNLEMLFYILFAIGIYLGKARLFAAAGLLILVLAGAVFDVGYVQWRFWTMPILLEFIAGLALASFIRPAGRNLGLALVASAIVAFALIESTWRYSEGLRPLAWGGPAFLLVCGALAIERAGAWPKTALKPLERIGDASYSLYLTHGIVIAALHRKLGTAFPINAMIGLLCLAIAFAVFYGFEKPVGRTLNQLVRSGRAKNAEHSSISTC